MSLSDYLNQNKPTTATAAATAEVEEANEKIIALKARVHAKAVESIGKTTQKTGVEMADDQIFNVLMDTINTNAEADGMSRPEKTRICNELMDEICGLGPLEVLIHDDSVSEIMVNSPKQVYVERHGKLVLTDVKFQDNAHVMSVIEKIVSPLGRHCDDASPMVDARLADGSRVNAIIPPLALKGPCITIRKFAKDPLKISDMVGFGSVSPTMAQFLEACVKGRLNIIISGGTGSGKTTLLNVMSSFIPADERIVTIEDAAELQLHQDHVVTLESRPANTEGVGAITIRDLVRNALRMRPDRIIVGECRGGEALDMLQAMNTGHEGSMTTGHANTTRDLMSRLETMVMMAGMDLPEKAIREQIASGVNLIVQQTRFRDGTRKVTNITEITGMEGGTIVTQDIFRYENSGRLDDNGKVIGKFVATGFKPQCIEKMRQNGVFVHDEWFAANGQ